jgi:hypothetical protein
VAGQQRLQHLAPNRREFLRPQLADLLGMIDRVRGAAVVVMIGRRESRFESCHQDDRLTRLFEFAYRLGVVTGKLYRTSCNTLSGFPKSLPLVSPCEPCADGGAAFWRHPPALEKTEFVS